MQVKASGWESEPREGCNWGLRCTSLYESNIKIIEKILYFICFPDFDGWRGQFPYRPLALVNWPRLSLVPTMETNVTWLLKLDKSHKFKHIWNGRTRNWKVSTNYSAVELFCYVSPRFVFLSSVKDSDPQANVERNVIRGNTVQNTVFKK